MKTIDFPPFSRDSAAEALRCIPERDDVICETANLFWLGSVDAQNRERVQKFIELCEQGRFDAVGEFADISQACVYAVLARRRIGIGFRLFVLQMHPSPHAPQRCLLTKVFDDLQVREKQGPAKDVKLDTTLSLKAIIKSVLR